VHFFNCRRGTKRTFTFRGKEELLSFHLTKTKSNQNEFVEGKRRIFFSSSAIFPMMNEPELESELTCSLVSLEEVEKLFLAKIPHFISHTFSATKRKKRCPNASLA